MRGLRTTIFTLAAAGLLPGCSGDDVSQGTETDGASTGTDTADEMMPTTGEDSTSDDGLDDTTTGGPPMSDALEPCDPRDADPCDSGICSGAGHSGFYCRPACSSMAAAGDSCGSDDLCLPDGFSEQLACFDVEDCDFIAGDPCGDGETCAVLTFEPLRTACLPSAGGSTGSACGPAGPLACDAGAACLGTDLDGDDAGTCQLWCEPGEALPDGCSQCIPLTDSLGTCAGCSVLHQDCPEGQGCQPINELLGGVCLDDGPGQPGDACNPSDATTACEAGSLCFETATDDVYACIATCDPTAPMCPGPDDACVDIGFIVEGAETGVLGLCLEGASVFCDPSAEPTGCQAGEICLEFEEGLGVCGAQCDPTTGGAGCDDNAACFPSDEAGVFNVEPFSEGNGTCGLGCSDDTQCAGETCLLTDGIESDGVCGVTCTPAMGLECGAGESCVPTAADAMVGACIPGGSPCDESMVGGCPTVAACVTLDGGGSSVCMPPCFEQDPAACGAQPANCQGKTEDAWHLGVCLDLGEPCDPIEQDCAADEACDIVGGGPTGGVGFACDEAGPVEEGGDCSVADCVQ
ncbi:MAG: hypothetical protein JKY37_02305, partial [Nannocystaceae bacterium]|nr:hypothetical protein [Nannocystaceae bacterium]